MFGIIDLSLVIFLVGGELFLSVMWVYSGGKDSGVRRVEPKPKTKDKTGCSPIITNAREAGVSAHENLGLQY